MVPSDARAAVRVLGRGYRLFGEARAGVRAAAHAGIPSQAAAVALQPAADAVVVTPEVCLGELLTAVLHDEGYRATAVLTPAEARAAMALRAGPPGALIASLWDERAQLADLFRVYRFLCRRSGAAGHAIALVTDTADLAGCPVDADTLLMEPFDLDDVLSALAPAASGAPPAASRAPAPPPAELWTPAATAPGLAA